jgi:hypothetical protein
MRTIVVILLLTVIITHCGPQEPKMEQKAAEYFTNNEDKFGFLVFENARVDSFIEKYSLPQPDKERLADSYKNLLHAGSSPTVDKKFGNHSTPPEESDHSLAKQVLDAAAHDEEKYFTAGLHYLFFYECLPPGFQYKWTQTYGGDFQFNVTFFRLLREKCKVFEDHLTNNIFHWDENMEAVFDQQQFNEITSANAALIKDCIVKDPAFSDKRLQADRDDFIFFLDAVIEKKWRLFVVDNN